MSIASLQRPPLAVLTLVRPPEEIPLTPTARARVRLLEVRLDRFAPGDWKSIAARASKLFPQARLLATLRFQKDGGAWPDDAPRDEAFAAAFALRDWDYLALEWDAFDRDVLEPLLLRRSGWTRLVCSRHDFTPPPEGLEEALKALWTSAQAKGAAVAKWAGVLADPAHEIATLCAFAALHAAEGPIPSLFAMGQEAQVTRIASPLLAGGWSYGHDGVGEAAPGQLPWNILEALLASLPQPKGFSLEWLSAVARAMELAQA